MITEPLTAPDRAEYAAAQTQRSSDLVADGQLPLRRIRAPFVPAYVEAVKSMQHQFDGASSWDVRAGRQRAILCRIGPDGLQAAQLDRLDGGHIEPLPDEGLVTRLCQEWVSDKPPMMVFETLGAARRLWMVAPRFAQTYVQVQDAADDVHKKAAHQLEVFATLPTSSRMVVLERAVNQLFWKPASAGDGSYTDWLPSLSQQSGFDGMADVLTLLLDGHATPDQVTFATAMVRAETLLAEKVSAFRNAGSATGHYALATRFMTAFEAYRCADRDFFAEACSAGSAPLVRPVGVEQNEVVAQLSTPCRLKPGRMRLYLADGTEIGLARLRRLTFSDRLGLVGVFGTDSRGLASAGARMRGSTASHGYQWLFTEGRMDRGKVAHMVEVPYLSSGAGSTWTWTRDEFAGPQIHRDVPLDVSIAGAGS